MIQRENGSLEQAISEIQELLGKGLYSTAIPKVHRILDSLYQTGYRDGYDEAQDTVGQWYEPKPYGY